MIKTVDWLKENISLENLLILDSSLEAKQARISQIPGSKYFDLKGKFSDKESGLPNMMPSAEQFQIGARDLGLDTDSIIVVYDNIGIYTSARVWYMFRSMGHQEVYVLDGGLPEWLRAGFETEEVLDRISPKGNFAANFDPSYFCKIDLIKENQLSQTFCLLDARSSGRFEGKEAEPRKELLSGNIEGSASLPFTKVLENGKFLPKKDLAKLFSEEQPLIFTCGSGVTACIILLASEIAGIDVSKKVYDGSWTEWATVHGLTK